MDSKTCTIQATPRVRNALKAMAKKEKRTIYGLVELMVEERLVSKYNGVVPKLQTETFVRK